MDVATRLLAAKNIPLLVAAPLLLQEIKSWKEKGVLGLQSAVLYSLPELDGAVDTVVLGGLVGDKIALVPERVRKLARRIKGWHALRVTPKEEKKISILCYVFPPNVGAIGTAALLNVPRSLEKLLVALQEQVHPPSFPPSLPPSDQRSHPPSIPPSLPLSLLSLRGTTRAWMRTK